MNTTIDLQGNPTHAIRAALAAKNYRLLARHTGSKNTGVEQWLVYNRCGDSLILVLQCFRDGSCELFGPICWLNSIENTIAAIP